MEIKQKKINDILIVEKDDRRLLANVPDVKKIRSGSDRRCTLNIKESHNKLRYEVNYRVVLVCRLRSGAKKTVSAVTKDISISGMLVLLDYKEDIEVIEESRSILAKFEIKPGTLPEGYEMNMRVKAKFVRKENAEQGIQAAIQFDKDLKRRAKEHRGNFSLISASVLLAFVTIIIIFMRAESVLYFKFNKVLYFYSIMTAVFLLTRYLFGACYHTKKVDYSYTPGVSIIIPCFNEEKWIQKTILSCLNQEYPLKELEVIVVDDCSTDHSIEKIQELVEDLRNEGEEYDIENRLQIIEQKDNLGKREALVRGALCAKHELVVFVDSDSFLNPDAIIHLVQPFKDPKMGGVAGRTDVANTYTNVLTKMQSVRYYIAFRIMKAAEACFDAVTCLSGPLSCYRKDLVLKNKDKWLKQRFLGQKATFGDDRAMTNYILEDHRTSYQDSAVCSTIVPNQYGVFLKQQMRWKRSWLRESLMASRFMWKKEPFAAAGFYMGLIVPVLAPVIVLYNLILIPILHHVVPTTFLVGMLMMALMMSVVQLLLRKSSTWLFGLLFCLFYEGVLLWQMPVAWVTFWKTTWGTRMTKSDVETLERRKKRKHRRKNTLWKDR